MIDQSQKEPASGLELSGRALLERIADKLLILSLRRDLTAQQQIEISPIADKAAQQLKAILEAVEAHGA